MQQWDKNTHTGACRKYGTERYLNVSIIHYTYGQDFDAQGRHTYGKVGPWHWDKRDSMGRYPSVPIPLPPLGSPQTAMELIKRVNEAAASMPYWRTQVKP